MSTPNAELIDPGTQEPPDDMPPTDDMPPEEPAGGDDAPTPGAATGDALDAQPQQLVPIYTLLPDGAVLPAAKPVIDVRLTNQLEARVRELATLPLETAEDCRLVDDRLAIVRKLKDSVEAQLDEPIRDANSWHKSLTGLRAKLTANAKQAIEATGQRLFARTRQLQQTADAERRRLQEEADAAARAAAQAEAADAAKSGDSHTASVLREHAERVTAPPVTVPRQSVLTSSSTRTAWKARLKGTDRSGEAHEASMRLMMQGCLQGLVPISYFEINWSAVNKRASADKDTLDVPGLEAYEEGKLTAKAGRRG